MREKALKYINFSFHSFVLSPLGIIVNSEAQHEFPLSEKEIFLLVNLKYMLNKK